MPDTSRDLTIMRVPLDALHPDPSNARAHPDKNLEAIRASLARFGQAEPLVVQAGTGRVIGGNGRLAAMRTLGWTECDVVELDLDDLGATALGIALNRTAETAAWDEPVLARLLDGLRDADALDGVGFSEDELDALLHDLEDEADVDDAGADEPPEDAVTRPGDVWLLGRHRLLCGDSTDADDVKRLLAGAAPGLMVTDPPYGVSYRPEWRQDAGLADGGKTAEVANDDRVDWTAAWRLFPGSVAYVWHAGVHAGDVAAQITSVGFSIRSQIIWAKPTFAISRGHYHWRHEPAWYAVRDGEAASWNGDHAQCTVWDIAHDRDDVTEHSTQKPLECMLRPMRNHDIADVYDPFVGSGTTIIAAERARRRCFAMELTPPFCDVTVARWERTTGEEAVLEETGETFAVTAERRRS